MTNILTAAEAARFARTTTTDSIMTDLLPMVDEYVKRATGRDWTQDNTINPVAKIAAGQILAVWYDNPGLVGKAPGGAIGALTQLEAEASKYRIYQFIGGGASGSIPLLGAQVGDVIIKLIGYNGVTGDQSSKFESVISYYNAIQQTYSGNLYPYRYVVVLKSPAEDVMP